MAASSEKKASHKVTCGLVVVTRRRRLLLQMDKEEENGTLEWTRKRLLAKKKPIGPLLIIRPQIPQGKSNIR